MSNTVTGSANLNPSFYYTPGAGFLNGTAIQLNKSIRSLFNTSGVTADQVDTLYCNTLTFAASTPQTLDLTSLTDILGQSISFARVRLLIIRINSTTDGQNLLMGASGTNEWNALVSASGTITVYPSTSLNAGYNCFSMPNTTGAVVSGSHKTLKLDPGANAFSVDVIIAGCSS